MAGGIWQYRVNGASTSFMYWHTAKVESQIPLNAIERRHLNDGDVVPEAGFVNGNGVRVEARVNLAILPSDVSMGVADFIGALPVVLRIVA
ncbi:hypothetical protein HYV64_04835 [Candidatus Shapirobacteria bacterium]|nr:hypothetical protein [Candidatus Shapirobacteria bacterium]